MIAGIEEMMQGHCKANGFASITISAFPQTEKSRQFFSVSLGFENHGRYTRSMVSAGGIGQTVTEAFGEAMDHAERHGYLTAAGAAA